MYYFVEVFSYLFLCIATAGVFGLLQHYIPHLLNIAAMFYLSNLSNHIQSYFNFILNIKFTYFSIIHSLYMLSFACALVCLCVYAVFVLCAA